MVTAINVLDAGHGYTNAPVVVIEPPYILNPVLNLAPMTFLSFIKLSPGGVYQLQQFAGWYWTNGPISFTASNSTFIPLVPGGGGNYRLALNPISAQVFALPQVVNGFVVGATVTNGRSGYQTAPAVTIVGGGGTNATAVWKVSGGSVSSISIINAGTGYLSLPVIRIAAPPAASVIPSIQPVIRRDASSLAPYHIYQIQFKPDLAGTWSNWNNELYLSAATTNSQFLFITNNTGIFRVQYVQ